MPLWCTIALILVRIGRATIDVNCEFGVAPTERGLIIRALPDGPPIWLDSVKEYGELNCQAWSAMTSSAASLKPGSSVISSSTTGR